MAKLMRNSSLPGGSLLHGLSYDLWNEIINSVIEEHAPIFEAMQKVANGLKISKTLVEDLKQNDSIEIAAESWSFLLEMEPEEDEIDGFKIILFAAEPISVFEEIKAHAAADWGFSLEAVTGFEIEHGILIDENIFLEIEEGYGIETELVGDGVLFGVLIFDSQDIDNQRENFKTWR